MYNIIYTSSTFSLTIPVHSPPGALFSFVSAVQVLASVFGVVLYSVVYRHTLQVRWDHSPGISFFVMAALYLLSMPFIL